MDPFSILVLFVLLILVVGYVVFLIKYPRRAFPFPKRHAPDWISVSIRLVPSHQNVQLMKEVLTPYANELNWSVFEGPDVFGDSITLDTDGKTQKIVRTEGKMVIISPDHWGSITPETLFSKQKKISQVSYAIYQDVINVHVPEGQGPAIPHHVSVNLEADVDSIIVNHTFFDNILNLSYFLVDRMRLHDTNPELERELFPTPLEDDLRSIIQRSLRKMINIEKKNAAGTGQNEQKEDSIPYNVEIINSHKHALEIEYNWNLGKDLV